MVFNGCFYLNLTALTFHYCFISSSEDEEKHYNGRPFSCVCQGGFGDGVEETAECLGIFLYDVWINDFRIFE